MLNEILQGDSLQVLKTLPDGSYNTCVTSPPYWGLRDYGVDGQLGLEATPEEYVQHMVELFREVRRVLRDDGTLWLNLGDSYATGTKAERQQSKNPGVGSNRPEAQNSVRRVGTPEGCKTKDLIGIPWMVAFALRADGWYLRSDIIWHKPNPMPESVTDRPTKAHEYIFLLSKSERYFYDKKAIEEPAVGTMKAVGNGKTRNKRDVWTVPTKPFKGAHFATFPPDLAAPCILAGCPKGGLVLDPLFGAGTTGLKAMELGRNFTGIELNPKYIEIAKRRIFTPHQISLL